MKTCSQTKCKISSVAIGDELGRRTEMTRSGSMMVATGADAYGYNDRDELVSAATGAATQYAYQYDDIGNRVTSSDLGTNRIYSANELNQYTKISNLCGSASLREEFLSQFNDDGNKNISELVHFEQRNGIAAHYEYAPFGAVTHTKTTSAFTTRDFISENPFRFSSEYHDDTLGLVYYNYRHYNPIDGRWCSRDTLKANAKDIGDFVKFSRDGISTGFEYSKKGFEVASDIVMIPVNFTSFAGCFAMDFVKVSFVTEVSIDKEVDFCGSDDWTVSVPEVAYRFSLFGKPQKISLSECCCKHDEDYKNKGLSKLEADYNLLECIYNKIRKELGEDNWNHVFATEVALRYFLGVSIGGYFAWENAQNTGK